MAYGCKIRPNSLLCWKRRSETLPIYHSRRSNQRAIHIPIYGTEWILNNRFCKKAIEYFGYAPDEIQTDRECQKRGVKHIICKNLLIKNVYQRTQNSDIFKFNRLQFYVI